jgi:hypothetical protein
MNNVYTTVMGIVSTQILILYFIYKILLHTLYKSFKPDELSGCYNIVTLSLDIMQILYTMSFFVLIVMPFELNVLHHYVFAKYVLLFLNLGNIWYNIHLHCITNKLIILNNHIENNCFQKFLSLSVFYIAYAADNRIFMFFLIAHLVFWLLLATHNVIKNVKMSKVSLIDVNIINTNVPMLKFVTFGMALLCITVDWYYIVMERFYYNKMYNSSKVIIILFTLNSLLKAYNLYNVVVITHDTHVRKKQ